MARQYVGARRIVGPFVDDPARFVAAESTSSSTAPSLGFGIPFQFAAAGDTVGNGYPRLIGFAALGTIARSSQSYWVWVAATLGVLVILVAGGGFVISRRRAFEIPVPAPTSSTDSREP